MVAFANVAKVFFLLSFLSGVLFYGTGKESTLSYILNRRILFIRAAKMINLTTTSTPTPDDPRSIVRKRELKKVSTSLSFMEIRRVLVRLQNRSASLCIDPSPRVSESVPSDLRSG